MKRQLIKIMMVSIIIGCSASLYSQSNVVGTSSAYDLYVAGRIGTGYHYEDTACYWKNDVRYNLSPYKSRVSALFIDGKDVYISGHYHNDVGIQPCYWKNGNLVNLKINGTAYTSDIFVSGNSVYVAGHHIVSDETLPCYWKNGVKKDLEVLQKGFGYTKSITGNGKDSYIAGFLTSVKDGKNRIDACYWKNDKLVQLNSSPFKYSVASEIAVDKEEIYIAGRLDDTEKECLCIWKDTTRIDYSTVPNKYSDGQFFFSYEGADYNSFTYDKGITHHKIYLNSMGIFNGDLYIVGKQDNRACYWINGKITELDKDGEDIFPGGITVIDQNILIVGRYERSICIWENGVKKDIVKLNKNESPSQYGFMKN